MGLADVPAGGWNPASGPGNWSSVPRGAPSLSDLQWPPSQDPADLIPFLTRWLNAPPAPPPRPSGDTLASVFNPLLSSRGVLGSTAPNLSQAGYSSFDPAAQDGGTRPASLMIPASLSGGQSLAGTLQPQDYDGSGYGNAAGPAPPWPPIGSPDNTYDASPQSADVKASNYSPPSTQNTINIQGQTSQPNPEDTADFTNALLDAVDPETGLSGRDSVRAWGPLGAFAGDTYRALLDKPARDIYDFVKHPETIPWALDSVLPGFSAPVGASAKIVGGIEDLLAGLKPTQPAVADVVASQAAQVFEGIYEFVSRYGLKYVGQSGNIPRRIQQHIASGFLDVKDLHTLLTKEVLGGKIARELAEQFRIDALGGIDPISGIKVLANKINPIGAAREYLLPPGYR
jgi:hypothetical protein